MEINKYNFIRWIDGITGSSENAVKFNFSFPTTWHLGGSSLSWMVQPAWVPDGLYVTRFGSTLSLSNYADNYLDVTVYPVEGNNFTYPVLLSKKSELSSIPETYQPGKYRVSINVISNIDVDNKASIRVYRDYNQNTIEYYTLYLNGTGNKTFDLDLDDPGEYSVYLAFEPKTLTEPASYVIDDFKLVHLVNNLYSFETPAKVAKYNSKNKDTSCPIMVPGESTSFYINTLLNIQGDIKLHLVNANNGSIVTSDIGTLNKLEFNDGFHLYCSFDNPSVSSGFYRLGITDADNILKLASNPIFLTDKNYLELTRKVSFRHNSNFFGYMYESIPEFYNQFRISLLEIDQQTDFNIDQYKSVTSGKRRNYNNKSERYRKFETYYFDSEMHEAASAMIEHDLMYIDDLKYTMKNGYKINTDQVSRVCKGEFEVYDDQFITDRKYEPLV